MPKKAQDDDLVMTLVELALARPSHEREAYLHSACANDSELFSQVWHYVEWEQRMEGFMLDPLFPPPANEHPFQPRDLVDGRFRIVREVAQGGMGIVYEAVDEKLERRIALKCAKTGFRKRLPPEVRNAREISHPNVCKIFEIHTTSTQEGEIDFITMEFLEGETLAERLRSGLSNAEARAIAQQLCAGLAEAHRNKVIHGDLKSNNVILTTGIDGAMRAVITDFGLARKPEATQKTSQSGPAGGTPDYMAPELWKGEKPSFVSDVYALGVILRELVSGPQFNVSSTDTTAPAVKEEQPSRTAPGLHRKWNRVIARCLDPDPARRFRGGGEVAQALAPSRTWKRVLAIAAAVALAMVSGTVAYQQATAPKESVHLAILPFESSVEAAPLAGIVSEAAEQLTKLKSSARTRLTVIPLSRAIRDHVSTAEQARTLLGATHVLHGRLDKDGEKVILHAYLTDARSQVNGKEWKAEYSPGEMRYVPTALAALVTGELRLPPLAMVSDVNAAGHQDYVNGLTQVRRDAGVDSAVVFLERAVASDPDSPLTYAALAEAEWFKYYFTRDPRWLDRARESVRQAERRNTDVAPVHRISGLLKSNAGLYEAAIADYLRAIELEPRDANAHRRLGMTYESKNQFGQALAEYLRAVEIEPGYYRNQQQLGSFYYSRADYEHAVPYFMRAVDLAPDELNPRFALSVAYTNLGRFAEAESELRFSISSKETPSALHALGLALMYQGKDQEAIPYFLRSLDLRPQSSLSWMYLGIAYRHENLASYSEQANRRGLKLAEEDLQREPGSGYLRCFVGYFSAALGDRRRAESEIEQALQQSPNDADTRWRAILTYEVLGQREASLRVLSTAPATVIADISRWPDVADLRKDSRFLGLLASHQIR